MKARKAAAHPAETFETNHAETLEKSPGIFAYTDNNFSTMQPNSSNINIPLPMQPSFQNVAQLESQLKIKIVNEPINQFN